MRAVHAARIRQSSSAESAKVTPLTSARACCSLVRPLVSAGTPASKVDLIRTTSGSSVARGSSAKTEPSGFAKLKRMVPGIK